MIKKTMIGLVLVALLAGCSEEKSIYYNGELMTISEVEERIADELEVENPDVDLEMNISEGPND